MSMKKTILFRANSSSTIGTGHIMRDLVLAKQYKEHNIIFVTQDLEGNINHKIVEAGYKIELIKDNSLEEFQKLVQKHKPSMVVIDSYDIDYAYEKKLKTENTALRIMVLDDTYEKHYCDILLNHNISADEKGYTELVPSDCELRCGKKYTLIRDEFIEQKRVKTLFVAMGGADHSNINIEVLEVLKEFYDIEVNLVTTTANKHLEVLKSYVKDKEWIELHINSNKIANLMRLSDLAIITPSVTLNEVFFMDLPFIAIKTAENQRDMYEYLQNKKFLVLNRFSSSKLERNIVEFLKSIK